MPTSADDIAHLLRRSGFCAPAARVAQLTPLDWPAAVEAVLDTTNAPADAPPASLLTYGGGDSWRQHITHLQWWFDRCVSTPTPIVEKLLLFWHGHFVVSWSKIYHSPVMMSLSSLYRAGALGKVEPLAQATAVHPGMLWYLDNVENTKGSPNLNFARELMELFLLGVGNYTEDDVVAAARAWTGHSTNNDPNNVVYVFRSNQHDADPKTFFGTTRNWNGPEIITEILTNPTKRPIVARHFAKKLWEFFAYQNPEPTVVQAIADAFVAADLEIKAAVRAIFLHPQFRSTTAKQGLVRSPVEFIVATMSAMGLNSATIHPEWVLDLMGQDPFDPPNVSGWRPNAYWVNTSSFNGRAMFARNIGWYGTHAGFLAGVADGTAAAAVAAAEAALSLNFSTTTRNALTAWFDRQRSSEGRWAIQENLITLALLSPEMHTA